MILIKLGGSIITNKKKPISPKRKSIDRIVKVLKKIDEEFVVVHGGGSYGHYWSVKYDMHTKPSNYDIQGVSIVKNSMVELNKIILDSFLKNKLNPYCLPPASFMDSNTPIKKKIFQIGKIAKAGLIPITYGDALWYKNKKSFILSGDKIMSIIAKLLRPRLSIFVLNEDGVYSNYKTKELILHFDHQQIKTEKLGIDVTGGISRKINEAMKISRFGLKVFFVNGNKPTRITDAIKKQKFNGTLFG